jgi:hypothetical protein
LAGQLLLAGIGPGRGPPRGEDQAAGGVCVARTLSIVAIRQTNGKQFSRHSDVVLAPPDEKLGEKQE